MADKHGSKSDAELFRQCRRKIGRMLELIDAFNEISDELEERGYGADPNTAQFGDCMMPHLILSAYVGGCILVDGPSLMDSFQEAGIQPRKGKKRKNMG